jgi:phage terminase large subunit
VIDELTLYSYKIDKLTEEVLPILEDKNNHCIDAMRYALEGIRKRNVNERKAKPAERPYHGANSWMSL